MATSVNRVKGLHFLCRKQSTTCFFLLKMPQNYINQFATERKNCREKVFYITTFREIQKRPSTGVLIKGVLKKHSKFTGKHPCRFKVTLLKSHFGMGVPLKTCCIFSEYLFLRTPLQSWEMLLPLTISWRSPYHIETKSMDRFLYDRDLRYERVKTGNTNHNDFNV